MTEELIQKYFQNNCNPEEAKQVLQWFETKEGGRYFKKLMEEKATDFEATHTLFDVSSDRKHRVLERIKKEINSTQKGKRNKWKSRNYKLVQVAASVVFIALCVGVYFLTLNQPEITYQTAYGDRIQAILPDGSEVYLNGNSTLSFKENFNDRKIREVWLKGEAYFQVTHTASDKKFIVHNVDQSSVEVLGTEFNIDSRVHRTKVVLSSGKVKFRVEDQKQEVVMKPDDLIKYETGNKNLTKKVVNPEIFSSWKGDKLLFQETSLADIKESLENAYGFKINVKDSLLLQEQVSGSIPNTHPDEILDGLSRLLNFEFERINEEINIYKATNQLP